MKPHVSRRRLRSSLAIALLALAAFSLPATMRATTIYNNIVSNCCGGVAVAGSNFSSVSIAQAFVSPDNYLMTSAQVEVFQGLGFGGDPYFNIDLFSNSGNAPGTLIAVLGTDLTAPSTGGTVTVSGANLLLTAGTEYWLVLTPFDNNTDVAWEEGGPLANPFAFTVSPTGAGGWNASIPTAQLQFAINASLVPTPEPNTLLLLGTGLAGLLAIAVRSQLSWPLSRSR